MLRSEYPADVRRFISFIVLSGKGGLPEFDGLNI